MMHYDYRQGKSRVFSKLKTLFCRSIPAQSHYFRWLRQFMSGENTFEYDERCDRMATTDNPENVSRVESLIKEHPKMTYVAIQDIMKISSASLTRILHDSLGVRKRCVRWVPHKLSEARERGRVDWCTHMLRKFDGGRSPRVLDIVTGDETWVYQFDPETKQQSAVWVFPDENPPVKFEINRSASKQMIAYFFAKFGHVATIALEDRRWLRLTSMSTHVCLKSSRHGVNGVPERVSMVFCSIMTMPARTQQL